MWVHYKLLRSLEYMSGLERAQRTLRVKQELWKTAIWEKLKMSGGGNKTNTEEGMGISEAKHGFPWSQL